MPCFIPALQFRDLISAYPDLSIPSVVKLGDPLPFSKLHVLFIEEVIILMVICHKLIQVWSKLIIHNKSSDISYPIYTISSKQHTTSAGQQPGKGSFLNWGREGKNTSLENATISRLKKKKKSFHSFSASLLSWSWQNRKKYMLPREIIQDSKNFLFTLQHIL